jgi:hypothetical protein
MNTQKLILSGLLALSLAAISAQAVILPGSDIGGLAAASQPGDLVLGFRNASATSDLAVDIGQFSAYRGLAAGTYTIGGFQVADLTSVFTTNAFSANTFWTVFGSTGNGNGLTLPDSTIWASSNSALARASGPTQQSLGIALDTFVSTQLASSTFGSTSDATALTNKSFTALGSGQSAPYSYFGQAVESSTLGSTSLKLWELQPGSGNGTLLGTFTLDSTGLTFTVAAIPEPSTYAAILGVATLGFVAIRRRKQTQLLA